MSDLPELLEAVTQRLTEFVNAGIDASGGEHFGVGDLRSIAVELIDYTLNREFGTDAAFDGSQAPSGGAVASQAPNFRKGQCAECPYKLNGIFAETGCPNCPNRCSVCGVDGRDTLSICDRVCVDCDGRWSGKA